MPVNFLVVAEFSVFIPSELITFKIVKNMPEASLIVAVIRNTHIKGKWETVNYEC